MKCAAGELPVHEVDLLAFIAIRLDDNVLMATADALDLAKRREQIVDVQVVQRIDRINEIERPIGKEKLLGFADGDARANFVFGVRDCILRNIDAGDFRAGNYARNSYKRNPLPQPTSRIRARALIDNAGPFLRPRRATDRHICIRRNRGAADRPSILRRTGRRSRRIRPYRGRSRV